jgi:hypothetical protein
MRPAVIILLPLLSLIVSGGCVAVPIPHPEYRVVQSRRWIKPQDTAGIRAGVTTRADVMCLLGEPDFWWGADDRVLAYQWTTSNLGVAWAAGGGYQGAAGFIDVPIHHFLVVSLDPQHRVRKIEFHDPPVGWLGPEYLQKLAARTPTEAK